MIVKEYFYSVACDRCQLRYSFDNDILHIDKEDAEEDAINAGWIKIGKKHYCPDCVVYDEKTGKYKQKD